MSYVPPRSGSSPVGMAGCARQVGGGIDAVELAAVADHVDLSADHHGPGAAGVVLAGEALARPRTRTAAPRLRPSSTGRAARSAHSRMLGLQGHVDAVADHGARTGRRGRVHVRLDRIAGAAAARRAIDARHRRRIRVVEEGEDLRADEDRHVTVAAGALAGGRQRLGQQLRVRLPEQRARVGVRAGGGAGDLVGAPAGCSRDRARLDGVSAGQRGRDRRTRECVERVVARAGRYARDADAPARAADRSLTGSGEPDTEIPKAALDGATVTCTSAVECRSSLFLIV